MRLSVVLLALFLPIPAASAQDFDARFTICTFDFESCVPLTAAAVRARGLSGDETGMIEKLRRLTVAPSEALIAEISASFGPPRRPTAPDLWFPDARDDRAECMACGLHLIMLDDRLVQINWGVQGRFRLIFNDPPPK